MHQVLRLFVFLLVVSHLGGCNQIQYRAEPISIEQTIQKLQQKSPTSLGFETYLIEQGYPKERIPVSQWDLELLTYSALYHHSALDVAKSQLALAQANVNLAAQKPPLGVGGKIGLADRRNDDISPWVFNLTVEIPIITANKVEIRLEEAEQQLEVARLEVANKAWQLRQQLVLDMIDYEENQRNIDWLTQLVDTQAQLVAIVEKRLALGLVSTTELAGLSIELQKRQNLLIAEQTKTQAIVAKIASDAGLDLKQFKPTFIARTDVKSLSEMQKEAINVSPLQQMALFNRVDIRSALASYAAAEAKLKLEIAKQTPDISLLPSYVFELGDQMITLGLNTLFGFINPQQIALIHQAEHLRSVEAARFEALQATVIANLSNTLAVHAASLEKLKQLHTSKNLEQAQLAKVAKQFDAGMVDRLALTLAKQTFISVSQQHEIAQLELLRIQANLENVIQKPLIVQTSNNTTHYEGNHNHAQQ